MRHITSVPCDEPAPNHSPNFFVDEKALVVGVRTLAMVAVNYLAGAKTDYSEMTFLRIVISL